MKKLKTKPSVIYAIQCVENGKVYVGCTQDFVSRISTHFLELRKGEKTRYAGRGNGRVKSPWQQDYDLYGRDAFKIYVLEKDVQPKDAYDRERYWIKYYNSTSPKSGYNWTYGRVNSWQFTVEPGIPERRTSNLSQKPQERRRSDAQQQKEV